MPEQEADGNIRGQSREARADIHRLTACTGQGLGQRAYTALVEVVKKRLNCRIRQAVWPRSEPFQG